MPHIHEKVDFVADAYIVYNNRVLLRMHDKYHNWLPPGGHIELDEDPNQAAIREAKEEVGLDIVLKDSNPPTPQHEDYSSSSRELIPPVSVNRHRINDTHEHVSFAYFATTNTAEIKQGNREISDSIHWFTDEELDHPKFQISERIKWLAHRALDTLKNN